MILPIVTVNGSLLALYLLLASFVGFQIGSIVEYRKKYNFADLELDEIKALLHQLTGFGAQVGVDVKAEFEKAVEDVKKAL